MNINDAFPSEYLRASDLKGTDVLLKIDRVEVAEIGGDTKPILFFQGKNKGLVLNKTNGMEISRMYGPDTDGWEGGEIILFPTRVDFQGRMVDAIRVKIPPRKVTPPKVESGRQPTPPPPNDDIPF